MKLEITFGGTGGMSHPDVQRFTAALELLHGVTPLDKFTLKPAAGGYEYRFDTTDGRVWKHILNITGSGNYTMTIDVSGVWHVREFIPHRPLRDLSAILIATLGVTKVEATWP